MQTQNPQDTDTGSETIERASKVSKIFEPAGPADEKSEKLAQQESENLFKENERGERLKGHVFNIVCFALWVFTVLFVAMVMVWAYHIAAPEHIRWLSELEVHMLERIVFGSSILITVAARYFKKYNVF
jgi:hypothetical protein